MLDITERKLLMQLRNKNDIERKPHYSTNDIKRNHLHCTNDFISTKEYHFRIFHPLYK
jgi:hypothetical protein